MFEAQYVSKGVEGDSGYDVGMTVADGPTEETVYVAWSCGVRTLEDWSSLDESSAFAYAEWLNS